MNNALRQQDSDDLRARLQQYRQYLDDAIQNNDTHSIAKCRADMFVQLAQLDPSAFDLQQTDITRIRRQIISILSDADAYLTEDRDRLNALLLKASNRSHHAPDAPSAAAALDSNLIKRTNNLRTLRQKMAEYRLLDG